MLALAASLAVAGTAAAQGDLSGRWAPTLTEDWPERIPGPELGDYSGLPVNDEARLHADSWSPARYSLPEHQCRAHTSPYIMRSPVFLRIWEEVDPDTQTVEKIMVYMNNFEQLRTIYMDGREHPPEHADHTWQGFSTGHWEGNMLTVDTTHIKQGYIRRNGLLHSDQATLREHFVRHVARAGTAAR